MQTESNFKVDVDMNTFFRFIFDFNEQVIELPTTIELNPLTQKQFEWTNQFVLEEMREFAEAYAAQDIVGMVDAIIDGLYGMCGTLKKMGLTRQQALQCFLAVHEANMSKKRGVNPQRGGTDEDAVKPADFVPPEAKIAAILGLTSQGV